MNIPSHLPDMAGQKSSGLHGACFESREFTLLLQDMECHACAIAGRDCYSSLRLAGADRFSCVSCVGGTDIRLH